MDWKDLGLSYSEALHGIQSAISFRIEGTSYDGATPKHLRVGVNSALSNCAALAELLIKKGVFTEEEYLEEMRLAANHELAMEQEILSEQHNTKMRFR